MYVQPDEHRISSAINIFAKNKKLWNELVPFVKSTGRLDLSQQNWP
jgi:hypothetical protein